MWGSFKKKSLKYGQTAHQYHTLDFFELLMSLSKFCCCWSHRDFCTYCCSSTFVLSSVTSLPLCVCPRAETLLWEDRLQQGHVQQVDQSGQGTRGRPQDIQSRACFTSTCYHGSLWLAVSVLNMVCLCGYALVPRWRALKTRSERSCYWCRKATWLSWRRKKRMSWRRGSCSLKCKPLTHNTQVVVVYLCLPVGGRRSSAVAPCAFHRSAWGWVYIWNSPWAVSLNSLVGTDCNCFDTSCCQNSLCKSFPEIWDCVVASLSAAVD